MPKNVQTATQLHWSHTLPKYCSKFSKPGFNSIWTVNFQMFKLDLQKGEEPEIKLPTTIGSSKKQESSRKTSTSALLTIPKPVTVWITTNCGKFFYRWKNQTTLPASWEICMQMQIQLCIYFFSLFHYRSLQDVEYSSLCYTASSHYCSVAKSCSTFCFLTCI